MDPRIPPLVVKVGGSLLRRGDDYARIASALDRLMGTTPVWVVVSAAKGATDALAQVARGAEAPEEVLRMHERLAGGPLPAPVVAAFDEAVAAAKTGRADALMAWGEQASANLLRRRLAEVGRPVPVFELAPAQRPPSSSSGHAIVPGFYVRGKAGRLHILPRGGSDISAVLAAHWRGALQVRLWKEGGGIRLQPGVVVERVDAQTLLAWLGGRVRPIHPAAVRLAERLGIGLVLEDPWGMDGSTLVVGPTAGPIPSLPVAQRVAGEAP